MFNQLILFCLLLSIFEISTGCEVTSRVRVAVRIPSQENTISNTSIQDVTQSEDRIKCTRECAKSDECRSFFYNEYTKTCQLHTGGLYGNESAIFTEARGYTFYRMKQLPIDCYDVLLEGKTWSGVYTVYPSGEPKSVFCDQDTDGGGWLVFQRRQDGSENFYREWNDYEQGFGSLHGEFWMGNYFLARITSAKEYTLRLDLGSFESETSYAVYGSFAIGSDSTKYTLHIGEYNGTAGDSLRYHDGAKFTTKDNDNDDWHAGNCAHTYKGAWWYKVCHDSNLNGPYYTVNPAPNARGIVWQYWKGDAYSLKTTEMKFRPTRI